MRLRSAQLVPWSLLVRVPVPLGALLVEGWPALLGTLLIQEAGLWLAGRLVAPAERTAGRLIFLAAYALRALLALPTHYIAKLGDGSGALFLDDYTNDLVGEWLLRIGRGDGVSIFPGHQHLLDSLYAFLLLGIYSAFGYSPLLPKLLNVGLAALSAVLVYDLTLRTFNRRAAIVATIGATVLPTMVIWSIATLKETVVLFVALLGLWTIRYLCDAGRTGRLAAAALLLLGVELVLLDLRSSIAALVAGVLVVMLVGRARNRLQPWQLGLLALALVVVAGSGIWFGRVRTSTRPITSFAEDIALQIRHRRAQEAAAARSQLRPDSEVLSPTGSELPLAEAASDAEPFSFVEDVIDPLGYALLAPAPWQVRTRQEVGALAEMPIWYVLLLCSALAWWAAPRGRSRLFVVCLLLYAIASWLVLAATEGNLGNLLRHRLTLNPALLILGAAGLVWAWDRWRPRALGARRLAPERPRRVVSSAPRRPPALVPMQSEVL